MFRIQTLYYCIKSKQLLFIRKIHIIVITFYVNLRYFSKKKRHTGSALHEFNDLLRFGFSLRIVTWLSPQSWCSLPLFPPIALVAAEREAVQQRQAVDGRDAEEKEERPHTLANWHASWEPVPRGRWTALLNKRIQQRVGLEHGDTSFLIQFLSGHFRLYLNQMRRVSSLDCYGVGDYAERTFILSSVGHLGSYK